jgi:phosphoglycerate dehydrogenase-like enzyme
MTLSDKGRDQIRAVSSRIKLHEASELISAENGGDASARERLDTMLANADVFYGVGYPKNLIMRAPGLKWVQVPLAGVDRFLTPEIVTSQVIVTKAKIHERQISETVFTFILMLARKSFTHFRAQQQKEWERIVPTVLHQKTIGILGLGNIGRAVARIAKAFGMKVIATKAHPENRVANVDKLLPASGFRELMSQSDFLVILLPITPETINIIGETELRLMKPTSYLINVSRGGIVDENALIRALSENWIAGAGLDVFTTDPGPLPPESKFWELQNVIITPHNAGPRGDYMELINQQFCQNLKRFMVGRELIGVVDKRLKY